MKQILVVSLLMVATTSHSWDDYDKGSYVEIEKEDQGVSQFDF